MNTEFKCCYQCKTFKPITSYEPKQYPKGNWGTFTRCTDCRKAFHGESTIKD